VVTHPVHEHEPVHGGSGSRAGRRGGHKSRSSNQPRGRQEKSRAAPTTRPVDSSPPRFSLHSRHISLSFLPTQPEGPDHRHRHRATPAPPPPALRGGDEAQEPPVHRLRAQAVRPLSPLPPLASSARPPPRRFLSSGFSGARCLVSTPARSQISPRSPEFWRVRGRYTEDLAPSLFSSCAARFPLRFHMLRLPGISLRRGAAWMRHAASRREDAFC
jgi:hypothetical protein